MAMTDKIISGLLLTHGLFGGVWTTHVASSNGYPLFFLTSNIALALAGVIAGVGGLQGKRWAAFTGLIFWGIQLVHIISPALTFSFTLGLNVIVSAGWFGSGQVGLNIFALVMALWLASRLRTPDSSFAPEARISHI